MILNSKKLIVKYGFIIYMAKYYFLIIDRCGIREEILSFEKLLLVWRNLTARWKGVETREIFV